MATITTLDGVDVERPVASTGAVKAVIDCPGPTWEDAMRIRHLRAERRGGHVVDVQRAGQTAGALLKRVWIQAGHASSAHEHNHAHLVLVLSGTGELTSGADRRPIQTNDAIAIGSGESHAFRASADSDLEMVCTDTTGPPRESVSH